MILTPGLVYAFVFLLVFAITFGFISRLDVFKREDIAAIIALAVAVISLVSVVFVQFIMAFVPSVMLLLLFIFLAVLFLSAVGVPGEAMKKYLSRSSMIPLLIIIILLFFSITALGTAVSIVSPSSLPPTNISSAPKGVSPLLSGYLSSTYIMSVIVSPNVLSMIITFVVMIFAVYFMTRRRVPI